MKPIINNEVREFLGLKPLLPVWDEVILDGYNLFFEGDKLCKIMIGEDLSYTEIDTDLICEDRTYLLPTSKNGKKQKLAGGKLRQKKHKGVMVKIDLEENEIIIENRHNQQKIKIPVDNKIKAVNEMQGYLMTLKNEAPSYWKETLEGIQNEPKRTIKYKNGDIIRVALDWKTFAYGIIIGKFSDYRKQNLISREGGLREFHPFSSIMCVPIVIRLYDFLSDDPHLDLETIETHELQSPMIVMDDSVLRNEHPVVHHRALKESDIVFPMFYEIVYRSPEQTYGASYRVDDNEHLVYLMDQGYLPQISLAWGFAMVTKNEEDLRHKLPPLDNYLELSNTGISYLGLENRNGKPGLPYADYNDFIKNKHRKKVFKYFGLDPAISFDEFNLKFNGYTRKAYLDLLNDKESFKW